MSQTATGTEALDATAIPHQLILASAGTGKTYRLTNHYLGLVLAGVKPERILATTFTRKAAGEILGRILQALAEAVHDDKKRAELAENLPNVDTSPAHLQATLARLARSLDRVQVRTLDAFFAHLCGLFALDLGLPAGWKILSEVDARDQYAEAIARLLERADRGEWVELLRHLQRAAARRTHDAMVSTVGNVRSLWLESGAEAWERLAAPPALTDNELMAAREALLAVQLPCTNAGAVMKKWSDAHSDILEYAREGNWRAFIERGPVKRVIEGDLQFLGKPIPAEFVAALDPFLRQAAHVLLGETVRQNAATARFMGDFETILAELRSEEGGLRFEDLPRALAPAPAFGGPADDPLGDRNISIWFRLDGRIDHLLLDEFQDTSPLQWRVLRRLAEEILATGETGPHARSFFCVGDVKQSIYGWREAEPRLLADLGGDDGQFPILDPENLDISYRSAPLVLDTVNCVFESLSGCPALKEGPRATAAAAWDEVYEKHTAAKEHLPGSACLIQATPSKDLAEETAAVLELAVERVAAMVAEQPTATIAILLRRRMNIAPLIHRLAARGIRASDQGGNPLTDSEAVVQLLSLLHLADHPGDSIAAFHVATCPLGGAVGLTPENFREEAGTVAAHVRARLVSEGLGGFVLSFAQTVTSHYGHWDRRRFGQLVDLAHAYAPRAGLRPTSFVEHVRDTNVEDTTASNVKVMTIHGAKGLEFDAVVLPELDENFILHQPQLLSHRPHTFGPIETATCSPNRLICRLDEDLFAIRKERETREIRESLCLLYVAMTRAIHRLEMIVRGKGSERKNTQGRWSSILCHALGSEPDEDGFLWSHGDNVTAWCEVGKATGDAPSEPPPPFRLAPTTGPRSLPRRAPSTAEGGPVRRAADLIAPASSTAMEMGTLVHRLMEEVEWLEDFDAGDGDLLALLEPLCPEAPTREAARALFREALAYDAISSALSRGAHDLPDGRSARVENERAFAVLLEENGAPYLLTGFIDRLVVTYDGETPIAAEVIDHKTDHIDSPETLAKRTEHYRPQLEAYRGAVARMTGLAETAITCRLLFLRTGEASEL